MTCCPSCGYELEAKRKRRTQLPEGWQPQPVKTELTKGRDVAMELEKFSDHWKGTGEVKSDWDATWRNWLRNAPRYAPRPAAVGFRGAFAAPEHPCAGWGPNANLRAAKAFQCGLLVFEAEENAFRRSPAFAACKSSGEADTAFVTFLKSRAVDARRGRGPQTPKNPGASP